MRKNAEKIDVNFRRTGTLKLTIRTEKRIFLALVYVLYQESHKMSFLFVRVRVSRASLVVLDTMASKGFDL